MEAVIFIGIQASGKTSFYRRHLFETHLRLSLDLLKRRQRERVLLEACLAAKQRFVVDNTNVLRDERAAYIRRARAGGFRVVGYFFEPEVARSLAWNAQRSGKAVVPVQGVLGTLKKLERPHASEGFDRLYRVEVDEAGQFIVEAYDPRA